MPDLEYRRQTTMYLEQTPFLRLLRPAGIGCVETCPLQDFRFSSTSLMPNDSNMLRDQHRGCIYTRLLTCMAAHAMHWISENLSGKRRFPGS
jgi:hypothetical protein